MKKLIVPLAIIAIFLILPFLMVLSRGVCCFDDASFAVLAKNISNGMGYTLTLNYLGADFSPTAFNPVLGQGPVGILPVALAIWLFGISPIIPGLTQVAIEFFLLFLIANYLRVAYSVNRVSAFLFISLTLITLISGRHYEHWYAMLGESVSALLLFCGYLAWSNPGPSVRSAITAGLFFGLSVLTKEISAIFVIAFLAFIVAQRLVLKTTEGKNSHYINILLSLSIAGFLPFLIFEAWRLKTLGWESFLLNWQAHINFIRNHTPLVEVQESVFYRYGARAHILENSFFLGLSWFFLIGIVASLLFRKNLYTRNLYLALSIGVGIFIYFVYWLFFSDGPARYLYIGVIIWCFFISLPILMQQNLFKAFIPSLLCLALIFPGALKIFFDKIKRINSVFLKSDVVQPNAAELKVLKYLDTNAREEKIYTSWWAHVAALEYLSPHSSRFNGGAFSGAPPGSLVITNWHLVRNMDGLEKTKRQLTANNCAQVFSSEPYKVYRCTPSSARVSFDPPLNSQIVTGMCDGSLDMVKEMSYPFTSVINAKQLLYVSGWLAVSVDNATLPDEIFITLSDTSGLRGYIRTEKQFRPDLVSFFKKPILNNAGFSIYADVSSLRGQYSLGLAWRYRNKVKLCSQFDIPVTIWK